MGNNSSSASTASSRRSSAARELDKYTQPTGLYPSCPWELKAARRLILEKKIAPRFPGCEAKESGFTQECPICFMYYPGNLNVSTCCKKPICSECYLQIKPPKKVISCPYCNRETFGIKYSAPAVIELSSIYSERVRQVSGVAKGSVPSATPAVPIPASSSAPAVESAHYASVEDRQKLRDDLRSQLNIAVGPITTPAPVSAVAVQDALMYASPADASQLEELMILEAIRRSMNDLTAPKPDDATAPPRGVAVGRGAALSEDGGLAHRQPVSPSQIGLRERRTSSSARHSTTNPFDDNFDAASRSSSGSSEHLSSRSRVDDWNPFQSD
ncbi:hypothetical protein PybrP1_000649 [[Pythium] brassicae (nom. inval.)]|nr:hypothetical protein PybrP1_000649 [[Pythium] brassicae (nom. inval.)]